MNRQKIGFSHRGCRERLLPHSRPMYGAAHSSSNLTSLCSPMSCTGAPSSILPAHSHTAAMLITANSSLVMRLRLRSSPVLTMTAASMIIIEKTTSDVLAV